MAQPFLTHALDGGEWSASRPGERVPGIHRIGGRVGPRTGLDAVEKRKISCPCQESNPAHSTGSLSLYRLSYPGNYSKLYSGDAQFESRTGHQLSCPRIFVLSLSSSRQIQG
jgi:hypothetical protein